MVDDGEVHDDVDAGVTHGQGGGVPRAQVDPRPEPGQAASGADEFHEVSGADLDLAAFVDAVGSEDRVRAVILPI